MSHLEIIALAAFVAPPLLLIVAAMFAEIGGEWDE